MYRSYGEKLFMNSRDTVINGRTVETHTLCMERTEIDIESDTI